MSVVFATETSDLSLARVDYLEIKDLATANAAITLILDLNAALITAGVKAPYLDVEGKLVNGLASGANLTAVGAFLSTLKSSWVSLVNASSATFVTQLAVQIASLFDADKNLNNLAGVNTPVHIDPSSVTALLTPGGGAGATAILTLSQLQVVLDGSSDVGFVVEDGSGAYDFNFASGSGIGLQIVMTDDDFPANPVRRVNLLMLQSGSP